ncbi:glycerophosphoryl diester phosphodiesterase [Roseibacterium elongatum DSM 19469]|uniref:Glycerophosphoryl diester phosphodiesterase n=2 Tax=Roseicyclus elongatus TaxID=159346 RepID=W8SN55_9RHOB|nr:glycerophosphoryl diester phosphodiesterase [Roseibacterium elongatum DSM 19469]
MIGRVTICIAMAVCSVIPAFAQMSVAERLDDNRPLIAAWRSVSGGFPEGTLAGIRHALEHGVDMIDLHVQRTGDGRHIVFHDAYLNRMTDVQTVYPEGTPGGPSRAARGGRDYLGDYTLDDLRALSLLVDGAASEHPIPTLEEALDLIDGRALAVLTYRPSIARGWWHCWRRAKPGICSSTALTPTSCVTSPKRRAWQATRPSTDRGCRT